MIHRYLNGETLPRGDFIRDLLTALGGGNVDGEYERLITLRNEVREIIDPIGATTPIVADDDGVVYRQFDARRRRA